MTTSGFCPSAQGAAPEKFLFDYTRQALFVFDTGLLDRPATKEDVQASRALFHLDSKGRLHNLHLPAYGVLKKGAKAKQRERVLIVQAEVGTNGATTYGVIGPHDVRVVSGKDMEKTRSIRDWKREAEKDDQ